MRNLRGKGKGLEDLRGGGFLLRKGAGIAGDEVEHLGEEDILCNSGRCVRRDEG